MTNLKFFEASSVFTLPELTVTQQAILKSGCRILDDEQVDNYQERKEKYARAVEVISLVAFLVMTGFGTFWMCYLASKPHAGFVCVALCVPLAALMALLFVATTACVLEHGEGLLPAWATVNYEAWTDPAPEEIQDLVGKLLENGLPIDSIYVEHLAEDPFLVILDPSAAMMGEYAKYYVAAWDESGVFA